MNNSAMVKLGGWSLIVFAFLYTGMQLGLNIFFDFPAVLHGADTDTFGLLLAGGTSILIFLCVFSLLPLLLIPASLGSYYAFKDINEPGIRLGLIFATFGAFGLAFCLMRWPTFNWYLARFFKFGTSGQLSTASAIFHGLDDYLGLFVGGIFSKICISIWFFIVSAAMLKTPNFPKWIGYLGYIAAIYLLLTLSMPFILNAPLAFIKITNVFSIIEFLWLLAFGISLLYYKEPK